MSDDPNKSGMFPDGPAGISDEMASQSLEQLKDTTPSRRDERNDERQARTDSRIAIHQSEKAGDTDLADKLRRVEEQARSARGEFVPIMPENYTEQSQEPFMAIDGAQRNQDFTIGPSPVGAPNMGSPMPSAEDRSRIEAEANRLAPPSTFDYQGQTGGSPFERGSDGVVEVLREILQTLKSIEGKFPPAATYSE